MTTPAGPPPPGWYPDPSGAEGQRWWDGFAWTQHVGGAAAATATSGAPQGANGKRYATFWERLVAYLVDGLVLMVPLVIAFLLVGLRPLLDFADTVTTTADGELDYDDAALARLIAWLVIVSLVIQAGYFIGLIGRYGRTLGQRAVGIRVIVADGAVPGYGIAAKRWLIPGGLGLLGAVPVIGTLASLALLLDYLSMLWSGQKQCWHDMFAGTWVVHDRDPAPAQTTW